MKLEYNAAAGTGAVSAPRIPHPAFRMFLLFVIAAGVALRIAGLDIPDLSTDEAQAAFGVSPAWTPLGMTILTMAQRLFGSDIVVVRSVSVLFGILTLPLVFAVAKRLPAGGNGLTDEPTALLITALAAIFPSHVLFSRLAYLSVPLSFAWALLLLAFLRARERPEPVRLLALYAASVFATFIKTQGLLLPVLLLAGSALETRKRGQRLQLPVAGFRLPIILLFSLIPVSLFVLAHPGIAATLLLYGGNMYGVSDFGMRLATLVSTWWNTLGLFLPAIVLGLVSFRTLPWPVLTLLGIAAAMGLVLGPAHGYYTTHLAFFAIPLGLALMRLTPTLRGASVGILLLTTVAMLGPWRTPWSNPLFSERGFWNAHAAEINEALRGEAAVTVLGDAGHHLRWYLGPKVLVGKNMTPPYPTDVVVLLNLSEAGKVPGAAIVYVSEEVAVVRMRK